MIETGCDPKIWNSVYSKWGNPIRLERLVKINALKISINCDYLNSIFRKPWSSGEQECWRDGKTSNPAVTYHKLTPQ
jgi:hypothetical protein